MKLNFKHILSLSIFILCTGCKKDEEISKVPAVIVPPANLIYDATKITGVLKDMTDIPLGVAISYDLMKNDPTYATIARSEFDNVTFEYQMKHGAMVRNDGTIDFSGTDELVNLSGGKVYGHVLAWHLNNNAIFLRSQIEGKSTAVGENLIKNGDFEQGMGNVFTGWANLVGGTAAGTYSEELSDLNSKTNNTRALKVNVTKLGANPWEMQAIGNSFTAIQGKKYQISASIKSLNGNGRLKLIIQNKNYLENQIIFTDKNWKEYKWITAIDETNPQFKMFFNGEGSYLLDNVKIEEVQVSTLPKAEAAEKVDFVLRTWVKSMVDHYKGKVKAWDAVNEVYTDGNPVVRRGNSEGDAFFWAEYLGRGFVEKTFRYAKESCSDCQLFLNDYNLESNKAKLDSVVALAKELKAKNAGISGIGTQMHININTSYLEIDEMFKKLAETGLQIKVTELDVRINPSDSPSFFASAELLQRQAAMYARVINSYKKYVPVNQQFGITFWNMTDNDSWIPSYFKVIDYPTIWDKNYIKKPAYAGVATSLSAK